MLLWRMSCLVQLVNNAHLKLKTQGSETWACFRSSEKFLHVWLASAWSINLILAAKPESDDFKDGVN